MFYKIVRFMLTIFFFKKEKDYVQKAYKDINWLPSSGVKGAMKLSLSICQYVMSRSVISFSKKKRKNSSRDFPEILHEVRGS